MNDRAQQLLAAYQADTAPGTEREDALFESIVHRIVSADSVVESDELDADEPNDAPGDEADAAPRRGRRAIVVPVALATAAIAAGLVLAMSLRGQLVTAIDDASPSQAPNVETSPSKWCTPPPLVTANRSSAPRALMAVMARPRASPSCCGSSRISVG